MFSSIAARGSRTLSLFGSLILVLFIASPTALRAQSPRALMPPMAALGPDALHQTGANVTISLLTMGNGDELWEKFGHTAIWIHDNVGQRDTVFNWGVFDSSRPFFIVHFLQGLMLYQMGGETFDRVLSDYRRLNRTVFSQKLALTTPQKDSLLHLIQINAQPENLTYRYDYFRNNCSTRPRDMLDAVLGGVIRANSDQPTQTTYRWHAERLMQENEPLVMGVHIGLGEPADVPISTWQTMFLPKQLHDVIAGLRVPDSGGGTQPLVAAETVLYQSTRPLELVAPPNLAPVMTLIGVVIALLFLWLGPRAEFGSRGVRIAAAVAFGGWSLIAGLLGVVLALLWGVTDHVFAHANENLLLLNPLWLCLVVLLPMHFFSHRWAKATRLLSYIVAGLTFVALLAHGTLLSRQVNLAVIGLAMPPAFAIAWIVSRRRVDPSTSAFQG